MTYLSLGQLPICRELNECLRQAEQEYVGYCPGTNLYASKAPFIADDASLCGYGPVICNTAAKAETIYAKYGLHLVPKKSVLLMPHHELSDEARALEARGFPIVTDGLTLVGCPIGSPAFRQQQLCQKIQEIKPVPAAFKQLSQRIGYMILQMSFAHQLTYLLSICEQDDCLIPSAVKDFDHALDATLAALAAVPIDHPYLSTIRCLPSSMGGLGIPYFWSEHTEANRICSRNAFYHFVQEHVPALKALVSLSTYWHPINIGHHAGQGMLAVAQQYA